MRTTKRQDDIINKIITEEIQSALSAKDSEIKLRKLSKSNETCLNEDGPDLLRVDTNVTSDALDATISDEVHNISMNFLFNVDKIVFKSIADIINKHGMSDFNYVPIELKEDITDFDFDAFMEAQQTLVSDVSTLVQNYAKTISELAVSLTDGGPR